MTREEFIKAVGECIPDGMYSEETIQLAFHMFQHGYNYAVDKGCEFIQRLLDGYNLISIKDGDYRNAVWLEEQFKQAMQDERN